MKKRILCVLLCLLLLLLALSGCGNADSGIPMTSDYSGGTSEGNVSYSISNSVAKKSIASADLDVGTELSDSTVTDGSKLIKTAYATIKTENYEEIVKKIQDRVEELGGRIDKEDYNGYEPRTANLTVRIPIDKYAQFTSEFNAFGVVTSLSASVDDVTTAYAETLAKKEMLEEKVAKYKMMLDALDGTAKTETVVSLTEAYYDSMTDLARIQKSLDSLTDKVTFSTIYLTLNEVKSEEAVVKETIFTRIGHKFRESLSDIGDAFGNIIVGIIGNLPKIVVWCAILVGILVLVRFVLKKRYEKRKKAHDKEA